MGRNKRLAAVVVTVAVAGAEFNPSSVTDAGATEHIASDGAPEHASVTEPLSPPSGTTLKLYVAVAPAETVALPEEPGAGAIEKSVPFPERAIVVCPPKTLSLIVIAPL